MNSRPETKPALLPMSDPRHGRPAACKPLPAPVAWEAGDRLCFILLLLWLPLANAQSTNAAHSVSLAEVNRTMSEAKTVFTHFVQERHLSLFNEPLRSEGYLCFEQPHRLRWEVTQPYKSILVSDGSGVAQFEWMDDRWKKLDIGLAAAMQNVVSQIVGVMSGQYGRDGGDYTVNLAGTGPGPVITLTPRNEKMRKMIAAIEVYLAPDLKATRQIVLRETNGDFTDIQFDRQVVNLKFDELTFDRNAPLDLQRIRQTAPPTQN